MEKLYFDDTTYIWKTKLNLVEYKKLLLKEAIDVIESQPEIKSDGFGYKQEWKENLNFLGEILINNKLDEVVKCGINYCKEIYKEKGLL